MRRSDRPCEALSDDLRGSTVASVPELSTAVQRSRDSGSWTSVYECSACGALWEERYDEMGHGEVPSVHRLNRK